MNLQNYDEKPTLGSLNSMLIDKPQLKPIDLLVDRPIDSNVGRPSTRIVQPIVERFVDQNLDENISPYDEVSYSREHLEKNEPILKPRVKSTIKLNDSNVSQVSQDRRLEHPNRPASNVLAQREQQLQHALPDLKKKSPPPNNHLDDMEQFTGISHLLDELDNPDVVAKIKHIINEASEGQNLANAQNIANNQANNQANITINKELELENQALREQNRSLSEQSRSISDQSRAFTEKNKTLTEQLEKSLLEIKKLKKIAINLKEEKNEYMNKTETMLAEHKKLFSKVQKFEYDQQMFTLFTLLNSEVKSSLRGIFKIDTYENFIACGAQRSNIDSLWDFAKNRVQKQQFDEIETLNQILLYFIDIFNQTSNTPTIKIQEVSIGTNFDTEAHIKSSDSVKPAGAINKIYLIGYQNVTNDKILNKAIVLIGG